MADMYRLSLKKPSARVNADCVLLAANTVEQYSGRKKRKIFERLLMDTMNILMNDSLDAPIS
jgi:hypothetical protein